MDFSHSDKVRFLQERLTAFMDAHVYPAEARFEEEMARMSYGEEPNPPPTNVTKIRTRS